jgi:hypothetical protein
LTIVSTSGRKNDMRIEGTIEVNAEPANLAKVAEAAVKTLVSGRLGTFEIAEGRYTIIPCKRMEIHLQEAIEISDEIGVEFHKSNGDYAAIQRMIERKHGEGAIMLSLRTMVGKWHRTQKPAG